MEFPEKDYIAFNNYQKMVEIPAYVVADFESLIVGPEREHKPCGYAYQLVSNIDGFKGKEVQTYRGDGRVDVIEHFLAAIEEEYQEVRTLFEADEEIIMTDEDEQAFQEANECWLCEKELYAYRVRDHCHMTGKFLGAAHNHCNLRRKKLKLERLPVIFHNFKVSYVTK
eukprot:sb/3472323/